MYCFNKIKKYFHLICIFTMLVLSSSLNGQHRCMADEYLETRLQKDAKYAKKYNQLINMPKLAALSKNAACGTVITIPVAIHFNDPIDCSNTTCLLDIVEAQIDVMNEDLMAANADYQEYLDLNAACPSAYPLSTAPTQNEGACVQFCLARTNHPPASGLSDGDPAITIGVNDWPSASDWDGYLNIFVSNSQGGLGVSPLPGSADGDGFWVTNTSFGGPGTSCTSGGNLNTNGTYNLGRTATHEAGHYLGLPHVFGGNCNQDPDSNPPGPIAINDTPSQDNPFFGTATVNNCSDVPEECAGDPSSLFSFMDYTDDEQMVIFTNDQSEVINWHADDIPFKSNTTYCSGSYGNINCVSAPSCTDGVQNQDEQDVDCGGSICSDCASYCGTDFFDPGGPLSDYDNDSFTSWTFCPDNATQVINITFNAWNVENNNTCSWDEMIIYDGNDDNATQLGSWCTNSPGTVTSGSAGGCLHVTFESDFSVTEEGWEATIACSVVLPVDLSKFEGKSQENGNLLNWTTEIEIQNKGFYVQRSEDAKNYKTLRFINGQGDTNLKTSYSFLDDQFTPDTRYYYRLIQEDFNGDIQYSKIIQLRSQSSTQSNIQVFPNPVSEDVVNITCGNIGDQLIKVLIYNLDGKVLKEIQLHEETTTVDLNDFQKGIYLLSIFKNEEPIHFQKLIVLN